ncbi:MAG: hypothetical protein A3H96_08930 [Acidobacteria bacterium RIFCSPLOWO2_02_FULL_67_36]|nr:MAG: hypothetical protein A3H96_08930 [Acidobacteria bacterium RIFCSPLOWO2_02_FULL_67_36]OFW25094.1 MAG: hypothetical protein A3G21_16805 [Acidobacteria bacterium RIFCSPLOWO2_12_FULL_66_21]
MWVSAEAGFLHLGDPAGIELRDAMLWSIAAARLVSRRIALVVTASGNTSALEGFGAPAGAGAGPGVQIGDGILTVGPTRGLNSASPAYAIDVGFTVAVFHR